MATLAELRTIVRQRLGWPDVDAFVIDEELNAYFAAACAELLDLLCTMHGPTFMLDSEPLVTVPGQQKYALDAFGFGSEFVRLVRIDCEVSGQLVQFVRGNIASHIFARQAGWTHGEITYFYSPNAGAGFPAIWFDPVPAAAHSVRLWYTEADDAIMTADDDPNVLGHDEYLILDVMIKCREKEESDTASLVAQKAAYQQRMERLSRPLDVGQAPTISDMRSAQHDARLDWFRR